MRTHLLSRFEGREKLKYDLTKADRALNGNETSRKRVSELGVSAPKTSAEA